MTLTLRNACLISTTSLNSNVSWRKKTGSHWVSCDVFFGKGSSVNMTVYDCVWVYCTVWVFLSVTEMEIQSEKFPGGCSAMMALFFFTSWVDVVCTFGHKGISAVASICFTESFRQKEKDLNDFKQLRNISWCFESVGCYPCTVGYL